MLLTDLLPDEIHPVLDNSMEIHCSNLVARLPLKDGVVVDLETGTGRSGDQWRSDQRKDERGGRKETQHRRQHRRAAPGRQLQNTRTQENGCGQSRKTGRSRVRWRASRV